MGAQAHACPALQPAIAAADLKMVSCMAQTGPHALPRHQLLSLPGCWSVHRLPTINILSADLATQMPPRQSAQEEYDEDGFLVEKDEPAAPQVHRRDVSLHYLPAEAKQPKSAANDPQSSSRRQCSLRYLAVLYGSCSIAAGQHS